MWWSKSLPFLGLASTCLAISCAPVHLIVARGSFEPQGEGITASLSNAIKRALPGTTSEALVYPAVMPYLGSMSVGTANLKKSIAEYTEACPNSKLILIGYSQGGSVVMDALCSGGGRGIGPHTDGITQEQGRLIKLALSFGEPRFQPGMPYVLGSNNRTTGVSEPNPQIHTVIGLTNHCSSSLEIGRRRNVPDLLPSLGPGAIKTIHGVLVEIP
jgi:hypothetical protein